MVVDDIGVDIEAMKTIDAALKTLPPWRRTLALAFIVDRELGKTIAEPLWREARALRRDADEHGRKGAFAASRGGTHRAQPLPNAYPLFALDSDEDSESSCSGPFDTAETALARAQERVAKGQDETPRRLRRCRRVRATELPIAKHLLEQLEERIDTEVSEGSIPDLDHFARWDDQIVYATDNAEDALRTFLDTAFRVDMWAFDPDEEAPP